MTALYLLFPNLRCKVEVLHCLPLWTNYNGENGWCTFLILSLPVVLIVNVFCENFCERRSLEGKWKSYSLSPIGRMLCCAVWSHFTDFWCFPKTIWKVSGIFREHVSVPWMHKPGLETLALSRNREHNLICSLVCTCNCQNGWFSLILRFPAFGKCPPRS